MVGPFPQPRARRLTDEAAEVTANESKKRMAGEWWQENKRRLIDFLSFVRLSSPFDRFALSVRTCSDVLKVELSLKLDHVRETSAVPSKLELPPSVQNDN